MAEITSCPECQRQVKIPETLIGKMVKCPSCQATFRASSPSQTAGVAAVEEPAFQEPVGYDDDYEDEDDRPLRRRRRRAYLEPHRGGTILTLGIIGFVCLGIVFGPMAWVMGSTDLRKMREGIMDPEGEGLTRAGQICGMIVTILTVVALVFYCFVFGAIGLGGGFR